MDEEDKHSPNEYYYPENVWYRNWNRLHRKLGGYKRFINQQKSAKTNKKTATDINTLFQGLFHYMEAYGIKRSIQRYLSYMKYSFNILKDNEFEKSRN